MKRFLTLFLFTLLFAASCSKSDPATKPGDHPNPPKTPTVVTTAVSEFGKTTAVLGGRVKDVELAALTQVGVQYIEWSAGDGGEPAWDAAPTKKAEMVAALWSVTVEELSPGKGYAARAFVKTTSAEYFGAVVSFTTDPEDVVEPVVTTADITEFDAESASLGGAVSGVDIAKLTEAGAQYVIWSDGIPVGSIDWAGAVDCAAEPAASWSARAEGLNSETTYGVRAYAGVDGRRYYGETKLFTTLTAAKKSLTVAQLRAKYTASADVSEQTVRGYVVLSVPDECLTESFAGGTVILYDNTGEAGAAVMFVGDDTAVGMGAAGLTEGDYVEMSLALALRVSGVPCYGKVPAADVRVISRNHKINPVWATPAQLASNSNPYINSPVQLSRVYAEKPGVLFATSDNWFTDGSARFEVYAKAGSVVGQLAQNSATGTLRGICRLDGSLQIVPVKASDVAAFTGDDGVTEGTPKIEVVKEYYEFAPQGGTLVVNCKVTRTANLRLFADTRFIDTNRYSIDIDGERVSVTARATTTGVTADYSNFYLYLAQTKDGQRTSPVTLKVTQLGNAYESIPSLIQANDGELSSVHEAVVNGSPTKGMKLGSGNFTGHYTSDPLSAPGTKKLVFYAVGWSEGKHEAGKLYLRVENGGAASVTSFPLKINAGATGQAPFKMTVGAESRYEVELTGLMLDSAISFSTSPTFDKKSDDKTGRALMFGVQIVD